MILLQCMIQLWIARALSRVLVVPDRHKFIKQLISLSCKGKIFEIIVSEAPFFPMLSNLHQNDIALAPEENDYEDGLEEGDYSKTSADDDRPHVSLPLDVDNSFVPNS